MRPKEFLKQISPRHRRESKLAKRLIGEIRRRGFERIEDQHGNSSDSPRKYIDLNRFVTKAVHEANKLGLLNSKPLHVLDIGCGSGYFLFVLKSLGHQVVGLDIADTSLYNDTVRLLE